VAKRHFPEAKKDRLAPRDDFLTLCVLKAEKASAKSFSSWPGSSTSLVYGAVISVPGHAFVRRCHPFITAFILYIRVALFDMLIRHCPSHC
jgi:hypothetical protein